MSTKGPDPKVSNSELLNAVVDTDEPFATASQIAEQVGLSSWRVRQRMEKLADSGDIEKAQLGRGPYIYWREGSFSSDSDT